jgi:16S rRNA G966 N2-methylase RsmD
LKQNLESSDLLKKKRQGQYFSGIKLAKILAALVNHSPNTCRVIDPMAGIGDMLIAFESFAGKSISVTGIEIDKDSHKASESNLHSAQIKSQLIHSNAFSPEIWSEIGTEWDLVITNPPYVRYQSLSTSNGCNPSGNEIRRDLITVLSKIKFENEIVKDDFLRVAKAYSGLSDLAVPCWILCMAICNVGGQIALILPSTWLSREYAAPVLYLLRRYFNLEILVEDPDVNWFPGTQVRTTALVATRVADKATATSPNSHKVVSLPKKAGNDESLVGNAFPNSKKPELDFAQWIKSCNWDTERDGIKIHFSDETDLIQKISKSTNRSRHNSVQNIPEKMKAILNSSEFPLTSLEELGWSVGQGMRTGANDFFYVSDGDIPGEYKSRISGDQGFSLPSEVLLPALIRQSELPAGYSPKYAKVSSYLLYLRNWELRSDSKLFNDTRLIEGDLQELIRIGESYSYLKSGVVVRIPELSAVKTNVRKSPSGELANNWFHLPLLADRHIPELFLPRIIGAGIKTYMNCDPKLVIDANFNTLWNTQEKGISKFAILALMNSDWTRAWLESICTSMGGGALKIEAINLKSLHFPKSIIQNLSTLETIGRELVSDTASPQEFQRRIAEAMDLQESAKLLHNLHKRLSEERNLR